MRFVEIANDESGYTMGLYICLGEKIYNMDVRSATDYRKLGSFKKIHEEFSKHGKLLIFITKQSHKIKKKAEQMACDEAIKLLQQ